ncbi:MAG: hypothetical protein JXK05_04625 [Campylobacterales bacterium]|nr:hypothetical protein [Campylobacterales bacterium]
MFKSLVIALALLATLRAEPINPPPFDYLNIQHAGNVGIIALGGGNTFLEGHYEMEFYLGLTPRTHSEASVAAVAMKNNLIPFSLHVSEYRFKPYAGLGLLSALNHRYDPQWRDELPDEYYYQDIWHFSAHFGAVFERSDWGVYVEAMTIDSYFSVYASSKGSLGLDDIFSLGVGLRIKL